MSLRPRITLYVDVVSPFAYEAYYILRNDSTFKECSIQYVPILLGGLMKACGNTAPIYIKNKGSWIDTERLRWARVFGIPMKDDAPPGFPPRTLTAMRAVSAVTLLDGEGSQDRVTRVLDALFHGLWVEHRPVHEPETLQEVLRNVLGDYDSEQVLDRVSTEGKTILASNTNKAFTDGAFGLPWMVCTDATGQKEGFWGVDHLGQVAQFLELKKPINRGWRAVL